MEHDFASGSRTSVLEFIFFLDKAVQEHYVSLRDLCSLAETVQPL